MDMNEKNTKPSEPKKRKKKTKKKGGASKTVLYLLTVLVISALLATTAILMSNDLLALAKEDKEITVTIPENATIGQVSKLLD